MKHAIILAILIVFIAGCSASAPTTAHNITGIKDLLLTEQDLQQLGMVSNTNETILQQLGIDNGTDCHVEGDYSNIVDSSTGQYGVCDYIISSLNDTEVVIQLYSFGNYESLNGSYQYDSSHYYSVQGLISENDFGDQSRFRVNNENDYGGEFNPPGVYFYHLWFTKGLYLIHITSSGTSQEAKAYIERIGHTFLEKFG